MCSSDLYDQIVPLAQAMEKRLENVLDPGDAERLEEILRRLRLRAEELLK